MLCQPDAMAHWVDVVLLRKITLDSIPSRTDFISLVGDQENSAGNTRFRCTLKNPGCSKLDRCFLLRNAAMFGLCLARQIPNFSCYCLVALGACNECINVPQTLAVCLYSVQEKRHSRWQECYEMPKMKGLSKPSTF